MELNNVNRQISRALDRNKVSDLITFSIIRRKFIDANMVDDILGYPKYSLYNKFCLRDRVWN